MSALQMKLFLSKHNRNLTMGGLFLYCLVGLLTNASLIIMGLIPILLCGIVFIIVTDVKRENWVKQMENQKGAGI